MGGELRKAFCFIFHSTKQTSFFPTHFFKLWKETFQRKLTIKTKSCVVASVFHFTQMDFDISLQFDMEWRQTHDVDADSLCCEIVNFLLL